MKIKWQYIGILLELIGVILITLFLMSKDKKSNIENNLNSDINDFVSVSGDYIKWVDFKVSYEALEKAYNMDIDTYGKEVHIDFIELLSYIGAKNGGEFNKSAIKEMDDVSSKLKNKETTLEELTKNMKYYSYYYNAYLASLGGLVGEYESEVTDEFGNPSWEKKYGLKCYSPIGKGFDYSDYDDFGVSRSFGFRREHLGHDMMGIIGTPIIAVESGYVEAIGWNKYGGWRIGIRSFDKKRYYYYAHLRQNYPYANNLLEGSVVTAGDVIGYMGHTGYSDKENVNNIECVHLHFGMQLIFDECQKECNSEIWIDTYPIIRFLSRNKSEVVKKEGSKEWVRVNQIREIQKNN